MVLTLGSFWSHVHKGHRPELLKSDSTHQDLSFHVWHLVLSLHGVSVDCGQVGHHHGGLQTLPVVLPEAAMSIMNGLDEPDNFFL